VLIQDVTRLRLAEDQQFQVFSRFAAFVMHDLKNSVAQLQLIVDNAARHRHNPAFMDDAIDTIANTANRMMRLIEQLQSRGNASPPREIDLRAMVRAAVDRAAHRSPVPALSGDAGPASVRGDSERLAAALDHVIRNAQEAAGPKGQVDVRLATDAGQVLVEVQDDGPGMEPEFIRDRLFKPFDSTKGVKGMGIGAYQVREYVRQIAGQIEVRSSPGLGTTFGIRLPQCQRTEEPC
jgi:putative PEP-CTERM system histidine kinase